MARQPSAWIIALLTAGMVLAVYYLLGQSASSALLALRPAEVAEGDQEIAWFNPATNSYAWTRFLAGLMELRARHPELGLQLDVKSSLGEESATLPAVGLRRDGYKGTLWLRWYKLTGQQGTREWLEQLLRRAPPPLAIVGGGSSDRARDLALALSQARLPPADAPLLLFTNATADGVVVDGKTTELLSLNPERSFRFCFSNRQMAAMILDFIWHEPSHRPTDGCAYLLAWKDDPYSVDLVTQFRERLSPPPERTSRASTEDPPPQEVKRVWERVVPYSMGRVHEPNEREAIAVQDLLQDLAEGDEQERALLVLPGEAKQARRVLRALFRAAPTAARRFVATVGDSVGFNAIYRDRRAQWAIQDQPCPLVMFCHRNPVSGEAGFVEELAAASRPDAASTSTDDLLIYSDVAGALLAAAYSDSALLSAPQKLRDRMRAGSAMQAQFDAAGNRRPGTGEYIVLLEPKWAGERVLPQARISVFARDQQAGSWVLHRRIDVDYAPHPPAAPSPE